MTLTQQTGPYAHWEYIHPENGDRLRIVPERGGIVTEWRCGDRRCSNRSRALCRPRQSIRGGISVVSDLRQPAR